MKKVLFVALMLLFTSSAYAAATFSITGDAYVEGRYWKNYYGDSSDYTNFGMIEQDINLYPVLTVGNTSLNFKVAITDTTWGGPNADGDENNQLTSVDFPYHNYLTGDNDDDTIGIERAWMRHKFNDVFTLDVGLMDGAVWATTFADDLTARWRIKLVETTPFGVFVQLYEKNNEIGATDVDRHADKDDGTSYAIGWVGKAGPVYIKPLIYYVDQSQIDQNRDRDGYKQLYLALAFNGDLGPIGFETEFGYKKHTANIDATVTVPVVTIDTPIPGGGGTYTTQTVNLDVPVFADDERWRTYGAYLNVWVKALDTMTPGVILAYGSYDRNSPGTLFTNQFRGFDFGDDFNSTVILGDELNFGDGGNAAVNDLFGMNMAKLYVNDIKTPVQWLTFSGYFAYVTSNQKDTVYEDAKAYETGIGATCKITDNLNYNPYVSYANIDYDKDIVDLSSEPIWLFAHALVFNF